MKKIILISALLFSCVGAWASNSITATVTVTNATVNGMTLAINSTTFTWTNQVFQPASQILTNADATGCGSATNLFNALALNSPPQVQVSEAGTNSITLRVGCGVSLVVIPSAGFASVSYSTNACSVGTSVVEPLSIFGVAIRTNVASMMAQDISDYSTNAISQNSVAASQLAGIGNTQTIVGQKSFNNTNDSYNGSVTNSPRISGNVDWFNGGTFTNAILIWRSAGKTNAQIQNGAALFAGGVGLPNNVGDAIWTIGDTGGSGGFQMGVNLVNTVGHFGILDLQTNSFIIIPPVTVWTLTTLTNLNVGTDLAVGGSASVGTNLTVAGNISFGGTQTNATITGRAIFTSSLIAFGHTSVSSLANGYNSGISPGTNTIIFVSGPTGAFTNCGFMPGIDGQMIWVKNKTGHSMTFANQSGIDPAPANRIRTGTGADLTVTSNPGFAALQYDGIDSCWDVVSHN